VTDRAQINIDQVAILALLPKRGWGLTAQQLATNTRLPLARVQQELQVLTQARQLTFDPATGEYRNPGENDA
jgi:DNA-binding IclR family transcriptional regulator